MGIHSVNDACPGWGVPPESRSAESLGSLGIVVLEVRALRAGLPLPSRYRPLMEGVLYFPYIEVPTSAWFTRTALYWDRVGTIVPQSYMHDPSRLSAYMRELVHAELVLQVEPWQVRYSSLREDFTDYIAGLSDEELAARREALLLGESARIHADKFMYGGADLNSLQREFGLVAEDIEDSFVTMERRTATEFMAALALTLCDTEQEWQRDPTGRSWYWVPASDVSIAVDALVNGLSQDPHSEPLFKRIVGHQQTENVRVRLLEQLLPVPADPVDVERIVRFRAQHDDLLPGLRRHVEETIDALMGIEDDVMRERRMNRFRADLDDRIAEAEAYLSEGLQRRIIKSPLMACAKFIPGLRGLVDTAQGVAGVGISQADFRTQPLAYLAFANLEFGLRRRVAAPLDPRTGLPVGYRPEDVGG